MIGIFINLWNRLTGGGTPAPTPALLDTYGGAAAAFSLRKLSSTYGGSAVRVRRSLDNTEQDIGFSGDNLDETALQAFVGYENLISYSEQFENAAWVKTQCSIVSNSALAPNGSTTADSLIEDTSSGFHETARIPPITTVAGQTYTFSVYVKQFSGTRNVALTPVGATGSGSVRAAIFNLSTGTFVGSTTSGAGSDFTANDVSIQPVGDGWFRLSVKITVSGTLYYSGVGLANGTSNQYVGNGTSGIYVWGAQLNQGVAAQPYQQTTATANTANGFVTKWYTQDGNGENLLLQSQTFENIYWSKDNVNVTANSVNAPDGTLTADKLYDDTTNSIKVIYRQNITAAGPVIQSVYMKAAEYNFGLIQLYEGNAPTAQRRFSVLFNLSSGTVETTFSVNGGTGTYGIEAAGNGWYRCWVAWTVTLATGGTAHIALSNSGTPATWTFGFPQYLGNGSSGIYIWGAQLSQSSWLQGYQATTTTAVSRRDASQATAASQPRIVNAGVIERENGKPSIRFDGVDDNLLNTNTIPTTTSLSVFATFRKISHVNNAGIFTLRPSLISPNDRDWASSNGRSFAAGVTPNGFQFIAHFIFSGSDGFSDPIDIKPNIALGSLISTSIFETGGLASAYTNGSVLLTDTYNGTPTAPTGIVIGARYDSAVNQFGNVSIPDLILYPTNLLPSRLAIESNVGSYYQTQWIGTQQALLDQFGGSAAAFSLRNLSSSYRGPLVRVRRSSDNAETDIGGTFSGDLDVNSLLAFTGGQNLLLQSEDIGNASWSKQFVSVTQDATIAPNGTLTADKVTEAASLNYHAVNQFITIASVTPFTFSVYLKAAERNIVGVNLYFNGPPFDSFLTTVDLSTGAYVSTAAFSAFVITSSVQNVGNGWWRVSSSGVINKTGQIAIQLNLGTGTSSIPNYLYTGVSGSGVYVWGAQLTTGSVLQPYIPTTTAAINGANAFVTRWYDQSGIGDNLILQSETFGNASWLKSFITVSDNTTTAPDNTITADTVFETTNNGGHSTYQSNAYSSGIYTYSLYLKYFNRKYVLLAITDIVANGAGIVLDLETASFIGNSSVGSGYSVLSYSITNAPNGWYRYSVTVSTSGIPSPNLLLRNTNSLVWANPYTGSDSVGVYVWGAQLSLGTELLRYQPTTTAAAPKRDAIQTTAASQPRIVNAGSVESENGKPALFWTDGSGMRLVSSFSPIAMPQSFFAVSKLAAVSGIGAAMVFDSYDNVANAYYFTGSTDIPYNALRYISSGSLIIDASPIVEQSLVSIQHDTTTNVYYDGRLSASGNAGTGTLSGLSIGNVRGNPTVLAPAYEWFGSIQELTVYPTSQSLRASVESNINSYYQIYWQGNGTALLDSFSGASAAYSLRNLSSAYTGPLIRVRRSNDNAERDIYGTFRGDLDLAALTSFVGANSGFVTTWYDQSGIGRHATQATAASQPRIVNAGAVDTENGKPAMFFDGTNDSFNVPSGLSMLQNVGYANLFSVVANNAAVATLKPIIFLSNPVGSVRFHAYINNTTYTLDARRLDAGGPATLSATTPISAQALTYSAVQYLTSDAFIYVNGSLNGSNTSFLTDGNTSDTASSLVTIGSTGGFFNGDMQEIILYTTNQLPSRLPIESNINNYYKIY